jgi:hypothetical protein
MLLDGLSRAAADPAGLPLLAGKAFPGLYPCTAPGKQVAQRCKEEGFLRVVRTETRGKNAVEVCTISDKGIAYLLSQVSPKQVLEDFLRVLEARHEQAGELLSVARHMQLSLEVLQARVATVLENLRSPAGPAVPTGANGSETWPVAILSYLARRQAGEATEDCPLPELYLQAKQVSPGLTIGHFHDVLRRLHADAQVYLHPWTGPLYDIPEPSYALLVGHEIAYYASSRGQGPGVRI